MRFVVMLSLALAHASPAAAQEPLKEIWVTQSESGQVVRGRLVELSAGSLSMLTTDNQRVDFPMTRVLRIETKGDSLQNGAIIGAVVMGALTALACPPTNAFCSRGVAINTGFGALLGVGVDAMNGGRATIYSRPAPVAPAASGRLQWRLRF